MILWGDELESLEGSGQLQPFFDEVLALPTVRGPFRTDTASDGTVMRFHFRTIGSTNDQANIGVVHQIRRLASQHLTPLKVSASLGGTLPFAVDEEEHYSKYAPRVFAVVLALSFVFLLIAFRSIAIPLKAVLLNLLSTTASFGILVLLFQSDYAVWKFGVIESFVPPLLFAILFGLSMDYHVFLLSRIREQKLLGVDSAESIRVGIGATARTITSAALIMVAVFLIIATLQLPVMKQLGMGLAIAIFIDATLVRTLLLPASMILLGDWNWYLPKCLSWLPQIRLH